MKPSKLIETHKLPCGPMSVKISGVCRRRLRDEFDALLDRLTEETHQSGVDEDLLEMEEQVDLPEEPEQEETEDEKREKMLADGKLKIDVKRELAKYEADTAEDPKEKKDEEETDQEKKKRMIQDGKMQVDVRKVVQKYEDKVMPKPKDDPNPKGKTKKS